MEEVDDNASFFPQGSKNSAKSQAKENDTKGIGTISVSQGFAPVRIRGISLKKHGQVHINYSF